MDLFKSKRYVRILIIFCMMALIGSAVFASYTNAALSAGSTGTTIHAYMGKGKDGKQYKSTNVNAKQPKYTVKVSGTNYVGYCINNDKDWGSGTKMTAKTYKSSSAFNKFSKSKQDQLSILMLYAYSKGRGMGTYLGSTSYGNSEDWYAASQVLVWQITNGSVVMDTASGKWTKQTTSDHPYKLIKGHTYGIKCYDRIKEKMSQHVKGMSFTKNTEGAAKNAPIEMTYNYTNKAFSVTAADTNKYFYYKQTAATSGLKMSRSGYNYTFTAPAEGTYISALMNATSYSDAQSMIFDSSKSSFQSVATATTIDDVKFYAAFTTPSLQKVELVKEDVNGKKLSGFVFNVKGVTNGYNETWTTGEDGTITKDLYPGTYTVTEKLTNDQVKKGWQQAAPVTILVKSGAENKVTIVNEKENGLGSLIIKKLVTDEGTKKGFKFHIEGLQEDQKEITMADIIRLAEPAYTDSDYEVGEWTLDGDDPTAKINEDAKDGKTGTYTVKLKATATLKQSVEPTPDEPSADTPVTAAETGDTPSGEPGSESPEPESPEPETPAKAETVNLTAEVTITSAEASVVTNGESKEKTNIYEMSEAEKDGVKFNNITFNGVATAYSWDVVTGEDGTVVVDPMENGSYTVTEVMSDAQKARYKQPKAQSVVIKEDEDGNAIELEPLVFENVAKTTPVRVIKKCVDGNIGSITFKLTGKTKWGDEITSQVINEDSGELETAPYRLSVTDDEGVADFGELYAGTYTFEEIDCDEEKYILPEPQSIEVSGDEKDPLELNFENKVIAEISISKQDGTTGTELPGASLQLTDKETGQVIEEWISGTEPHVIKGLIYGQVVILKELLPPTKVDDENGYVNKDGEKIVGFETANPIEITAGVDHDVVMVDELTQVVISKQDVATGRELPGASLKIIDKETGAVIEEWISEEEPHYVIGLIEGKTYTLREDQAPLGYDVAEEIDFTVGVDDNVTMYDEHTVIPGSNVKTGDNMPLIPFVILMALSALGCAAVLIRRKHLLR